MIGLTREILTGSVRNVFDEMLAARDLNNDQISFLQQTIIGSGALKKVETMIEELGNEALARLNQIALVPSARAALIELAKQVMNRDK